MIEGVWDARCSVLEVSVSFAHRLHSVCGLTSVVVKWILAAAAVAQDGWGAEWKWALERLDQGLTA